MNMLAIRTAQADLIVRIRESLAQRIGAESADAVLLEAIQADARAAGAAFAGQAPGTPSLEHFATILLRWQAGGALVIEGVTLTDATLSFAVTDCAYARQYADMGISPALGHLLSCSRDEPFAQGYSPCLAMRRSQTIMDGVLCCRFTFTWNVT
jgi:hypothetical protein